MLPLAMTLDKVGRVLARPLEPGCETRQDKATVVARHEREMVVSRGWYYCVCRVCVRVSRKGEVRYRMFHRQRSCREQEAWVRRLDC